jgi:2-methylcitrate dehydratase PrpD
VKIGKELIEFICQLTYDDFPSEVIHQTKRTILDLTGAMLIGSKETCSYAWSAFANACFA